jgi:hypothetical protein
VVDALSFEDVFGLTSASPAGPSRAINRAISASPSSNCAGAGGVGGCGRCSKLVKAVNNFTGVPPALFKTKSSLRESFLFEENRVGQR